jgi:hypothetical protein
MVRVPLPKQAGQSSFSVVASLMVVVLSGSQNRAEADQGRKRQRQQRTTLGSRRGYLRGGGYPQIEPMR